MDIFEKFLDITCATSPTDFNAISLSAQRKDFLARGANGAPIFLLHDASEAQYSPGVQFRYLTAQFHATCHVHADGEDLEGQFALISCDGSVPDLHEIFVRCFGAAIEELPAISGTRELNSCIQKLLDLFKALTQPGRREVSGLWAELYVIANSGDIVTALTKWHENSFDRFDFSWEDGCLEVKSSVKLIRLHEFSLEQLMVPLNGVGYVVSLLMQPLTGGAGVLDLAAIIEAAVQHSPVLKQKLWRNVAEALGSDFSDKLDKRFDISYTERRLVVYAINDVPRPESPSDPRVTSIKFSVDLTTVVSSLSKSSISNLHEIFSKKMLM